MNNGCNKFVIIYELIMAAVVPCTRSLMDRTEASDAFNAGSIPVGCILFIVVVKGVFMDKTNLNENAGDGKQKFQAQISRIVQMCKESKKVLIIIAVFLMIIIAALAVITFSEKKEEVVATTEAEVAAEEDVVVVPEEALEKDAYAEVNNLIKQYYQALVDGDMATIKNIKNYVDEEEELKIVKKSEFIESYPTIIVHTKKGPEEGSFVAYVQYEVKFIDIDNTAPGLNTLYICTKEDGSYYINAGELEGSTVEYLKTISVQNDVVDLFNTVQVAYNDIKAQDEKLSAFLDELPNLLAEAVSEAIVEQEEAEAAANPTEEEEEPEVVLVVTKVKTTDVVNVRSSDSVEADRLGSTSNGQVLELVEERLNGWSKVIFEGKEGFIKTEFLTPEETEMQLSTEVSEGTNVESMESADNTANTDNNYPKKGKVTDSVNIRKTSSTEADVVGILSKGTAIEILEELGNGWTKISHANGPAFVKSDFVEVDSPNASNGTTSGQQTAATKKGKVIDTVNVRKDSSIEATVVGILNKGTAIEVIEQMDNGWTKIKHTDGEAYIKSDFVEVQ